MAGVSAFAFIFVALAGAACATAADERTIRADLNGDGVPEIVEFSQTQYAILLKVQPSGSGAAIEQLAFGVDPGRHDAVCELPAVLDVVPLLCEPMEEPLPGCKTRNGAAALRISDGTCDSIHLYWDHDTGKLAWWRL